MHRSADAVVVAGDRVQMQWNERVLAIEELALCSRAHLQRSGPAGKADVPYDTIACVIFDEGSGRGVANGSTKSLSSKLVTEQNVLFRPGTQTARSVRKGRRGDLEGGGTWWALKRSARERKETACGGDVS
eukprot:1212381-Rhodomonas_salina.1